MRRPDFIIIGAQKSGTTALIYYLKQHPDVWVPPDEIHFFDAKLDRGIKWYLSIFDRPEKCVGEKTPGYLFHPKIPCQIKNICPDTKIIILLRNPIDRAYSEYRMFNLQGKPPQSTTPFSDLVTENGKSKDCHSMLARGRYAEQIKRVYKEFPKEQVIILKAEDLRHDKENTFKKILQFLDLTDFTPEDMSDRHIGGRGKSKTLTKISGYFSDLRNGKMNNDLVYFVCTKIIRFCKGINKIEGYPPMSAETRRILSDYFAESNRELEELTGITWKDA